VGPRGPKFFTECTLAHQVALITGLYCCRIWQQQNLVTLPERLLAQVASQPNNDVNTRVPFDNQRPH